MVILNDHKARAHARLSASGAARWLACTASPSMEDKYPDSTSPFAEQGTAAHEYSEIYLDHLAGTTTQRTRNTRLNKFKKENKYYDDEMEEAVGEYVAIVEEAINTAKAVDASPAISIEERLDFSHIVPDGFGTGDVVIVSDGTVEVIDLKYGKGVPVSAISNPQLRLYGLGALNAYDFLYDIHTVKMTIVQPRLNSVSTEEMAADDLLKWAHEQVVPKAKEAAGLEGTPTHSPGDACTWCKAKGECGPRAEYFLQVNDFIDEVVTTSDADKPSDVLTHDQVASILPKLKQMATWIKDIEAHALAVALDTPDAIPGFKVVEGRSNRKLANAEGLLTCLQEKDFDVSALYKPSELVGITELYKRVPKEYHVNTVDPFVVKPPGKPTLVPATDKRPAYSTADNDFSDIL